MSNAIKLTAKYNLAGDTAPVIIMTKSITAVQGAPERDMPGISKLTVVVADGREYYVLESMQEVLDAIYNPKYYLGASRDGQ